MNTRLTVLTAFALLAIAAFATSAAASPRLDGQVNGTSGQQASTSGQQGHEQTAPAQVDTVTALTAQPGLPNGVQLRRDGSRAVPVEFPTPSADPSDEGFDWTALAIGIGGVAALAVALAGIARINIRKARGPAHA